MIKKIEDTPDFTRMPANYSGHYYGIPVNGYDNKPIGALILIVKGNSIQNLIESIDVGG